LHPGIDTGYGTPRFLLAAVVRSIAREFEALTEAVFLDHFEEVIRDADRLRYWPSCAVLYGIVVSRSIGTRDRML